MAGNNVHHPITNWLATILEHAGQLEINGLVVTPASFQNSLAGMRACFLTLGIRDGEGLHTWLVDNGFDCSGVGGHFAGEAQEFILEQCGRLDARSQLLQSAYVIATNYILTNRPLNQHLRQHLRQLFPAEVPNIRAPNSGPPQRNRQQSSYNTPSSVPGVARLVDRTYKGHD